MIWSPYLKDVDGFPPDNWRMGSSLTSWIVIICHCWLVCQISALEHDQKCVKNHLSLKSILGGCWWFLTGNLEDGVILDILDHHHMSFLTCVPNFSSLAWLEVCQEPSILEVRTWMMLMVPDWRLGGWGRLWCHGSSWYVILYLCDKLQISKIFVSVSTISCPWCPCISGNI